MANLQALRTELDAGHPVTGAYDANAATAAAQINAVNRTRDRTNVPAAEILAAIKPADFLAITDTDHRWVLGMLLAVESVDLDNANIRTILTTIFAGKTQTLNALAALQTQDISRAQELGLGNVRAGTVAEARAL